MSRDVIVIGAGIAGLACARVLARAGRDVCVLDRAKAVGGRCATRRIAGQPVDYGPAFLHGADPAFLAAISEVEGATALSAWPQRVDGKGTPCQPSAFVLAEQRFTIASGLSAFPKHLAQGLTVQLSTAVTGIGLAEELLAVTLASGEVMQTRDVVLALALEQSAALLATLPADAASERPLASARALLGMFESVPSLTLIAAYAPDVPAPTWDICYPEGSDCLQLVAHDSSKRDSPNMTTLVIQARPRWSRERLDAPHEEWAAQLLAEAADQLGAWVATPLHTHPHRWRYARLAPGCALSQPLMLTLAGQARLGIAGDLFSEEGGVQAAWLSGTRLAERLLTDR